MAGESSATTNAAISPVADATPRKRRSRKRWILLTALIALVIVPFYFVLNWSVAYFSAEAERQKEIDAARARGQPVWFSDLEPPPVPLEEDGMPLFLQATAKPLINSRGFYDALDRADKVARFGDENGSRTVDEPELTAAVEQARKALDLLRQALKKPQFRSPVDYHARLPIQVLMPHAQNAREMGRLLKAEFHVALAAGETERALTIVEDTYALAEMLRSEQMIVTQLVRIAVARFATDELSILLGHGHLTGEQFQRVDQRLASLEAGFRLRDTILGEQACTLTQLENDSMQSSGLGSGLFEPQDANQDDGPGLIARPHIMREQAAAIRFFTQAADLADATGQQGYLLREELSAEAMGDRSVAVPNSLLPAIQSLVVAGIRHHQSLLNARVGLRVDRHYRQSGRLPDELSQVLDAQMNSVPVCLFSDLPLILKPEGEAGFVVYGPGSNGMDDGGGIKPDHTEGPPACRVIYKPALANSALDKEK